MTVNTVTIDSAMVEAGDVTDNIAATMAAAAEQERKSATTTTAISVDTSSTAPKLSSQESPSSLEQAPNIITTNRSPRSTTNKANTDGTNNDASPSHFRRIQKILLALILVGFLVFVIVDSLTHGFVRNATSDFLDWVEDNPVAGFFAFVLVYFVATVLFIPGAILTLGGGFIFAHAFGLWLGIFMGTLAVFVAASAGATVAFVLGRFLLREWVGEKLATRYPIVAAMDAALQTKGLRILILLRLSPLVPFNALNYIAGVTAATLRDYVLALLFILPGTILYVSLGASAGSLADSQSSGGGVVTIVSIVVGLVFGILAIAIMSHYARKELNEIVAQSMTDPKANDNSTVVGENDKTAPSTTRTSTEVP